MDRDIGRTRSGLRYGWTTGSCAAAAAKAAAKMLLSGEEIRCVRLLTPKGIELYLDVESAVQRQESVECAVRKYSGDDPDVTDGLLIFARVSRNAGRAGESSDSGDTGRAGEPSDSGDAGRAEDESDTEDAAKTAAMEYEYDDGHGIRIILSGGAGVGRVTKPGLEQPVGAAAINRVPRRMITEEVVKVCRSHGFQGTLKVEIFVPEGEETAKKTFNPRLGIMGGISILGTSGIVEPMSEKALTDTIYLEMKMLKESGYSCCYVVPGNYGTDFLSQRLCAGDDLAVKCSNYVGEAIDDAGMLGMKGVLLIGHVGKFIKLAAGVMNTHSRQADCRMEVFASHAAMAGADAQTVRDIMACINTAEAVRILKEKNILKEVMRSVMERIDTHLCQRAGDGLEIGAIVFSVEDGVLGASPGAMEMLGKIESQRGRHPGEEALWKK